MTTVFSAPLNSVCVCLYVSVSELCTELSSVPNAAPTAAFMLFPIWPMWAVLERILGMAKLVVIVWSPGTRGRLISGQTAKPW